MVSRWQPSCTAYLKPMVSGASGAQRLDPATKRPIGQPIDVYHSHGARRSLRNPWLGLLEISVSPDRLFFNLGETKGNIWLAEWKP